MINCNDDTRFLLPVHLKKVMQTTISVAIWAIVIFPILMLGATWFGVLKDAEAATVILLTFFVTIAMIIVSPLKYRKISQSSVLFEDEKLLIFDSKGRSWREIYYNQITDVYIRDIVGFFYGTNRDSIKNSYICIFLDGLQEIPNGSYASLFTHEKFLAISYQKEVYDLLKNAMESAS